MASVELEHIHKEYDNGYVAVHDLNLHVTDGEFLVLVGPSGCGKTTALRMIAGLEEITDGELRIGDRRVNEVPSRDRDIAMVFQSYALYPHMTVAENIGFGLRLRHMDKATIAERVATTARMLGLGELLDRKPKRLSGGQRQRVAMGRAIVREPQVFLMDEPLSNLDAKMRVQTRAEIAGIQRRLGVTTIYVTHDQIEAMTMGDRVAVMRNGLLLQVDTPQAIYSSPSNLFVAGFIGSPPMNLCEATVVRDNEGTAVLVGSQRLALDVAALARRGLRLPEQRPLALGIRPEDMDEVGSAKQQPGQVLRATVAMTEALGSQVMAHFDVDAPRVSVDGGSSVPADDEEDLQRIGLGDGTRFIAAFNARSRIRRGDVVDVAVDTSHLHFFDLETGHSLVQPADQHVQ